MERDETPPPNPQQLAPLGRRQLPRIITGMVVAGSAIGATVARVLSQEEQPASPAASPAAIPAATPGAPVTIEMTAQLRFEPAAITITVGETVTWVNASPIPHTATGDPDKNPVSETRPDVVALPPGAEPWDSGLLNQGQAFSHTFTVAGEYTYFCIPHVLSGMLGTITVVP